MFAAQLTRFQVGAAATALAAATVITPAAIAQARPDLIPVAPVTSMLSTDLFGTDPITGPITVPAGFGICLFNDPVCSSQVAALASPGTTVLQFTPLAFVPGFLKPVVGWFLNLVPQFSICIGGLGVSLGSYATLSVKTGNC